MKVFKVIVNNNPTPTLIEAEHYYEDGSFMNFFIKRKDSAEEFGCVASFNKMSITSIVMIATSVSKGFWEETGIRYQYIGTEHSGNDAEKIQRLNLNG